MIVKLLTEHHLEFLSLNGGCRGSSKSTHVKMPHCWKSHALAHIYYKHRNPLQPCITTDQIHLSILGKESPELYAKLFQNQPGSF